MAKQRVFKPLIPFLLSVAVTIGCGPKTGGSYPARPIKVVVPFGAGGGSDTFARLIQNAIESNGLLTQPLVIVNVPGAGGTIGSRRVKRARPDGYTLLLLHDGILTAKHSGQATYGPEVFESIAGSSNATQVIAVDESSPIQDLPELMELAVRQPDSVVFAANVGAPSYFAGLMLEAELSGAAFRYTQSGGGAKRFAALQGGHVDVTSFSIAEYLQFRPSGVRALALLAETRDRSLPTLPTAAEQGFDVVSQTMQFWWAPAGTPQDRVEIISQAIDEAMRSSEVRSQLSQMSISPVMLRGEPLLDELTRREERIASVAPRQALQLPQFHRWALWALVGCIVLAIVRRLWWVKHADEREKQSGSDSKQSVDRDWKTLIATVIAVLLYVIVLQGGLLGFQLATVVFTVSVGGLLAGPEWRARSMRLRLGLTLGCVALVMGVALHLLFTQVLVVDLP